MTNDRYAAKNIVLAQICSDGGKERESGLIESDRDRLYFKKAYPVKDACILKAIHAIQKSKNSNFRFYVKEEYYSDYLNKICYIVYFNFLKERSVQVSFHSFSRKLENYTNNKFITRWRKTLSSRESCRILKRWYYI